MSYRNTTFKTWVEDTIGYQVDVTVHVCYWMARRPFSDDDGDEIIIENVVAAHQEHDQNTLKIIYKKGEEVEIDEREKERLCEKFVQHLTDMRETALADRYDEGR